MSDIRPGTRQAEMKRVWPFRRLVLRPKALPREEPVVPGAGPDFLCVGGQKAGTTWVYEQLAAHPDFWMPPRKELHYLDERGHRPTRFSPRRDDQRDVRFLEKLHQLGTQPWLDLAGYGQLFAAKSSLLSGDITPGYCLLQDEIIAMVLRHFPKLKVIFLARDPVERVWSHLSQRVRTGRIPKFNVNAPEEVIRHVLHSSVVLRSYPSVIAARWRRGVPADQYRVFFFDDLQTDPAGLRRAIISFLGGDPEKPSGQLRADYNPAAKLKKLSLSNGVRAHLAEFYADELRACATELGGPATTWPARYL